MRRRIAGIPLAVAVTACMLLLGERVAQAQVADPCGAGTPLTPATLTPGDRYFSIDGQPTLLLGTNPYGPFRSEFTSLFQLAGANERVVRVFVHSLAQHPTQAGAIDENWITQLHNVLCDAEANHLYVLVVLDVWSNWNEMANPSVWSRSIYNVNNVDCRDQYGVEDGNPPCGPAARGWDLVAPGETQDKWLDWVYGVVDRLKTHSNVIGWEVFSEFDNIPGPPNSPPQQTETNPAPTTCTITPANEPDYNLMNAVPPLICLMENAAKRVREADDLDRPVTASQKSVNVWTSLAASTMDFLELHPYADVGAIAGGNLDSAILDHVDLQLAAQRLQPNPKPIFIGESGLDEEFPKTLDQQAQMQPYTALTLSEHGDRGIRYAIWAGAVSGAMNARNLWYEDGYDAIGSGRVNLCTLGLPHFDNQPECGNTGVLTLHEYYKNASLPVKTFLTNVNVNGFDRLTLTTGANVLGGVVGNTTDAIGWVRDVQSAAPSWPEQLVTQEVITVDLPGQSADWRVDFYNAESGDLRVGESIDVDQAGSTVTFTLPDFSGSIAFQIHAVPPLDADIRIKPQQLDNRINWRSRLPFPVAILPTTDIAVADINVSSLVFGPNRVAPVRTETVNVAGIGDVLVAAFVPRDTGLMCGDTEATLEGELASGRSFVGSDSVHVVGPGCPP